jgi:hypothetical protein
MDRETLRRYAQITLAVVAALAAVAAGFRYVTRGGSLFGEHLVVSPDAGPVGIRPFFDFEGFDGGQEVTVYLCAGSADVEDCAVLGKGRAGERLQSKPIPRELPDTTTVDPGTYVLRAGPDDKGGFPGRGSFEVIEFKVGGRSAVTRFNGVSPSQLKLGEPQRVARGAPCRPPLFLRDGRLAVGSTVVDPHTGVTIDFKLDAHELAWSPVGDKLAILTPDRKEIRLAAPDGSGAVTRVREARGLMSSLTWSPSGDRLAYIAAPDPATRQLAGDPTSPTVKILNATNAEVSSAGPGLAVSWSPDDDLLAVEMAGAVVQASTPQGGRRELTTGRRPAWSPDGRFLTVVRGEDDEGWVVPAKGDGGAPIAGKQVCALSFSPTGTSLAVVNDMEGQTTLFLRAVATP